MVWVDVSLTCTRELRTGHVHKLLNDQTTFSFFSASQDDQMTNSSSETYTVPSVAPRTDRATPSRSD
jgi:hypothetical protein